MSFWRLVWRELLHRRSQLVSGLLAITLGIGVIVGIQSVTRVSEIAVAIKIDNLGANIPSGEFSKTASGRVRSHQAAHGPGVY